MEKLETKIGTIYYEVDKLNKYDYTFYDSETSDFCGVIFDNEEEKETIFNGVKNASSVKEIIKVLMGNKIDESNSDEELRRYHPKEYVFLIGKDYFVIL